MLSRQSSGADPNVRYDRYRISSKEQQPWSETQKLISIVALTAMLADTRNKGKGSGGTTKDGDVCRVRFTVADGKSKPKPGTEIFRKVDRNLLWINNSKQHY
ncbi:hypothetical protein TWF481_003612 [Arthrobotrys musiformis]|uniref:Uncharacterized protein n=1 Tax=Arthrobotrys musiformis TaxID=47236 RepID=A0AAV9WI06_9PEZI